jgi:hypothetical protein
MASTSKPLFVAEVIVHNEQRYPTCGDWQFMEDGSLKVSVSDTGSRMSNLLVALHEVVEAVLCEANCVSQSDVDTFDMLFESCRTEESLEEPGDSLAAPYYCQHKIADIVERLVAFNANVDWMDHDNNVKALFEEDTTK